MEQPRQAIAIEHDAARDQSALALRPDPSSLCVAVISSLMAAIHVPHQDAHDRFPSYGKA